MPLVFIIIVVKFNGSVSEILDRINSCKENRISGIWNINLMPFQSIGTQLKHITNWWALRNIAGNIIPFIPFGFLLPMAYKNCRKLWKTSLPVLVGIIGIEVFQFVTMLGSFDVDDITLNFIGTIIGYIVFSILNQHVTNRTK